MIFCCPFRVVVELARRGARGEGGGRNRGFPPPPRGRARDRLDLDLETFTSQQTLCEALRTFVGEDPVCNSLEKKASHFETIDYL